MAKSETPKPEVPSPARILLNTKEVAAMTGISKPQLDLWRVQGKGPRYLKIGRLVRYARDDLMAWLDAHRVNIGEAA